MKDFKFTIPGSPRPKLTHRTFRGITTRHPANVAAEKHIQHSVSRFFPPLEGHFFYTAIFYFTRPKSHILKSGKLARGKPIMPAGKPDVSNLIKMLEDALNKHLWKDDSAIFSPLSVKLYGETARTELSVCVFDSMDAIEDVLNAYSASSDRLKEAVIGNIGENFLKLNKTGN